jgi:hypothetical protein
MTLPGRQPLSPGALRAPRRSRSATSAIVGTTVVAILGVLVVVLSYRAGHRESTASLADVSAVEARVDALAGQIAGIRESVRTLAKQRGAAPAKARFDQRLGACMTQVQREIDDLQAFLAYRTPPRRDRVSGPCRTLLKPRFGR